MAAGEVVTLQIGNYSNFVGTHWWNLQESSFVYDPKILSEFPKEVTHDVLFREGQTVTGQVTYTPRLVFFDLNNSLGSLKKEGTLYDTQVEDNIKWSGDITLHQTQSSKKNAFLQGLDEEENSFQDTSDDATQTSKHKDADQDDEKPNTSSKSVDSIFGHHFYNLDNDVKVWSDYLRTALHPRSTFLLQEYQHNNPEQSFNIYGLGQQQGRSKENSDAIEDKIRYFSEECDNLQGFHILLDNYDAFGGLASTVLTYLEDEYTNKARLSIGVTPACLPDQTVQDRSARILNSALSLHSCSEFSSLYIPLSLASTLWKTVGSPVKMPHLQYQAKLDYHTSAILSSALDTMTLPYRTESNCAKMTDITSSFNSLGRKVSALNVSFPFPLRLGSTFVDSLMGYGECDPWVSLTPHVKCLSSPLFNCCTVRGIPANMIKSEPRPGSSHRFLSTCTSTDDVLKLYLTETYPSSHNAGCVLRDGIRVGALCPHIFSPNINYQGLISDSQRSPLCGVETVPAMTSLQSSSDVYSYIDSLEGCVSRFNIAKHQHFIEAGLEPDEFSEVLQSLKDLSEKYRVSSDI